MKYVIIIDRTVNSKDWKRALAGKNKISFSVRIDEELYKKTVAVAEAEGRDLNNHILHLVRTNIAYFERVHGKVDTSKVKIDSENT